LSASSFRDRQAQGLPPHLSFPHDLSSRCAPSGAARAPEARRRAADRLLAGIRPPPVAKGAVGAEIRLERPVAMPRSAMNKEALLEQVMRHLRFAQGTPVLPTAPAGWLRALAAVCRGELASRWSETQREDFAHRARRINYLSMEFLMGRALANALDALDLLPAAKEGVGGDRALADLFEHESDAALGNGGLGRLAACFLDSMATLGMPAFGYGMRYQFGMFRQAIRDGRQVEQPDAWLAAGDHWCIARPEVRYPVGFGGRVEGPREARRWLPAEAVEADAFDFIVPGHGTHRVATLRLWQARAIESLDFAAFSRGEFHAAAAPRARAEAINWVLYPDDSTLAGRELRLKQEFLLVSASLQDIVARHYAEHGRLDNLADYAAIHLNDTHPALSPPELMRILVDERGMAWAQAWEQCGRIFSYTNHTLMPEALETWPVAMLEHLLPRHLEIIYEINHRFLVLLSSRFGDDPGLQARASLIEENGERRVKMAPLSIVASHRVNGVSKLHSELMVQTIFADYARIDPGRFTNVTNGVTPRRWLALANRPLAAVLDGCIGSRWRMDLDMLREFVRFESDAAVRDAVRAAKRENKVKLAQRLARDLAIRIDPASLFDVQVKRMHEYKRQLLNLLRVIADYLDIVAGRGGERPPRTVIFGGKAATAYHAAKAVIQLIHDVARTVNGDPRVGDRLKLVFVPNYGVSAAERIIPAADLSEQISTAGTEASGTGNMKFALNGALTIGTWDGANIEIAQTVGDGNIFIFGLRAEDIAQRRALGYQPRLHVEENPRLAAVLEAVAGGLFSPEEPQRYRGLVDSLLDVDHYFVLADFADYLAAQQRVDRAFAEPQQWTRMAIHNIAAMGQFSSDRTVREYARNIWNIAV
jgi:starch phosphorylase